MLGGVKCSHCPSCSLSDSKVTLLLKKENCPVSQDIKRTVFAVSDPLVPPYFTFLLQTHFSLIQNTLPSKEEEEENHPQPSAGRDIHLSMSMDT